MKPLTLIALNLLLCLTLTAQKTKNLEGFSKLKTSGSISVELVATTGSPKIEYEMIKGDEDDFIITNSADKLELSIRNSSGMWGGNRTQVKCKVYFTKLQTIKTSAGSSVSSSSPITNSVVKLDADSGSSLSCPVTADEIYVDGSSGSTIEIKGTAKKAIVEGSSGTSILAKELITSDSAVRGSSGSSIFVHATEAINADASSGATIKYGGKPKSVVVDRSSAGSVKAY